MSDITNDSVILHFLKVLASDDIFATSGGDKDGATIDTVIKGGNLQLKKLLEQIVQVTEINLTLLTKISWKQLFREVFKRS